MNEIDLMRNAKREHFIENRMKTSEKRVEAQKRKWSSTEQTPYIPNQSEPQAKKIIVTEEMYENRQDAMTMDMESVAYVNILYDENMLTNVQEVLAPEANYVSFETNWSGTDILDLDQRNYYYETPTTVDVHAVTNVQNGNPDEHRMHETIPVQQFHDLNQTNESYCDANNGTGDQISPSLLQTNQSTIVAASQNTGKFLFSVRSFTKITKRIRLLKNKSHFGSSTNVCFHFASSFPVYAKQTPVFFLFISSMIVYLENID